MFERRTSIEERNTVENASQLIGYVTAPIVILLVILLIVRSSKNKKDGSD